MGHDLATIDEWLQRHLPQEHARLRLPASEDSIAKVQGALPDWTLALPDAFRLLYRWHDGSEGVVIHNLILLSLEEARRNYDLLSGLLRDGHFEDSPGTRWNVRWWPFLSNQANVLWVIDLTMEGQGRIVEFRNDRERSPIRFGSLAAFIEGYAESLEAGLWHVDDGGLDVKDWEAWEALHRHFGGLGEVTDEGKEE